MNERGIEVFLAIAMTHNFQKAAEILNLTQSTVSHHLKELEGDMGALLVERYRGRKEVTLTNFGENLLPLAFRWQEVKDEMALARKQFSGYSLSIGGLDSVKNHVLLPFFRELLRRSQQIRIKLCTGSSTSLYERVAKREIDVAFVQIELRSTFVRVDPFYKEHLLLATKSRQNTSSDGIVRAETLDPQWELQIDWGYDFRRWHDNVWGPLHQAATLCDTLSEMQGLLDVDDFRWGIVPESSVPWFRREGDVEIYQLHPVPPTRIISTITHREPRIGAEEPLKIFGEILKNPSLGCLPPGCVLYSER